MICCAQGATPYVPWNDVFLPEILCFWRFEDMTGDCMEFPGGVLLNRIGVPTVENCWHELAQLLSEIPVIRTTPALTVVASSSVGFT